MKHVTFEGVIRAMNDNSTETEREYRRGVIAREVASADLPRVSTNAQEGQVTNAAIEYLLFRVLRETSDASSFVSNAKKPTSSEQMLIDVGEMCTLTGIHRSSGTSIATCSTAGRRISIPPGFSTYMQPRYWHSRSFFDSSMGVGNDARAASMLFSNSIQCKTIYSGLGRCRSNWETMSACEHV